MLLREYLVLRYLKLKGRVSRTKMLKIFPNFDDRLYPYIQSYINTRDINEEFCREEEERYILEQAEAHGPLSEYKEPDIVSEDDPDRIWYWLNHSGEEYLWERRRRFWGFLFPYLITTAIAAASLYLQFKQ